MVPLLHDSSVSAVASVGVGIILLLLILYRDNSKRRSSTKVVLLPPGPLPFPIVGNLHLLGELPHRALAHLAKKYGPLMHLRLGSVPTVVVSSPAMAKEFLKTYDLLFANRPKSSAAKYIGYNGSTLFFSSYGSHWRELRKLCTLELFTAKRIESFKSVREEEVSAMIRSISTDTQSGRRCVDVRQRLYVLTQNTICRIIAGRTYSDDELSGGQTFKKMIEEMFAVTGAFCIGDFIPFLDCLDLQGLHRRMKHVHKIFDEFADKMIDEHIDRRTSIDQQERVKDIVDLLLDMAETDPKITRLYIKGILVVVVTAAMETSATTIEWAMSELLRNPDILVRAQQDIESVVGRHRILKECDVPALEYIRCIVKETLRLYPPAPLLPPHESSESCSVDGYTIPKGTRLIVNAWAIGRDESVWKDAHKFRPERFIGKIIDVRGQDFELIPFGSGRRGCPAILMGISMVEFALAQLVHCFDWSIAGDPSKLNMDETFGLTVPRKLPLCAFAKWRLATDP